MAEDEDAILRLLEGIRSFGWDERKRRSNLRKHKVDFIDARRVFDNPVLVQRSDRYGEVRYQILGTIEGREIAVAGAIEGSRFRIISARRASRQERRWYRDRFAG
jgi:uncharacterized DUF497 family protein